MNDLKGKTIRGGVARLGAQGANFVLRIVSLMILARLLGPDDFGLVGMVTAFTGVLSLFRDFGLSSAAIQRPRVTHEEASTLFWINVLVGVLLGACAVVFAPAVAAFYREPRLVMVTAALAAGFVFNAVGVQHGVILQREMRFTTLAIVNTISLVIGSAIGIAGAVIGWGYWSLVAMTVTQPLALTVGQWIATGWIPGRPSRGADILPMARFGGLVTLNALVCYVAFNADKMLLGRVWGVAALGMYGRAYSLINIPTDNLNSAAGEVAFSALSRVQHDPQLLKNYFLKGYSLVVAMTIPITLACALFAEDVVVVVLGPRWADAAPIFRMLAPTILTFAIVNPLGWLVYALGRAGRGVRMALTLAPVLIGGYAIGVTQGPNGVAFAYSLVMTLWIVPGIAWAVRDTALSTGDVLRTAAKPLASGIAAGLVAFGVSQLLTGLTPLVRLFGETTVLLIVYGGLLLFVAGEKATYLALARGVFGRSAERRGLAST